MLKCVHIIYTLCVYLPSAWILLSLRKRKNIFCGISQIKGKPDSICLLLLWLQVQEMVHWPQQHQLPLSTLSCCFEAIEDSFLISSEGHCQWYLHYLSKGHVCQCPGRELLLLRSLATNGFMVWEILEDNGEFAAKLAVNMQMYNDSQDQEVHLEMCDVSRLSPHTGQIWSPSSICRWMHGWHTRLSQLNCTGLSTTAWHSVHTT